MGCIAGYIDVTRGFSLSRPALLFWAGVAFYVFLIVIDQSTGSVFFRLARTAKGAAFVLMVLGAWLLHPGGFTHRLLAAPPIAYLGKVSYALYVFHPFALAGAAKVLARVGIQNTALYLISGFVITVIWAALSWRFFEGPINDLKSRFRYDRTKVPPPAVSATAVADS
jgi:peptidoglycan/LPS O-acetylase OafA/YrhL